MRILRAQQAANENKPSTSTLHGHRASRLTHCGAHVSAQKNNTHDPASLRSLIHPSLPLPLPLSLFSLSRSLSLCSAGKSCGSALRVSSSRQSPVASIQASASSSPGRPPFAPTCRARGPLLGCSVRRHTGDTRRPRHGRLNKSAEEPHPEHASLTCKNHDDEIFLSTSMLCSVLGYDEPRHPQRPQRASHGIPTRLHFFAHTNTHAPGYLQHGLAPSWLRAVVFQGLRPQSCSLRPVAGWAAAGAECQLVVGERPMDKLPARCLLLGTGCAYRIHQLSVHDAHPRNGGPQGTL